MRGARSSYQKFALLHDLPVVGPDIEVAAHHVDVRAGPPIGTGMSAVRISKSHVHAWELLVLQDVSNDIPKPNVRANRELADAIAIFVRMGIFPELILEFPIFRVTLNSAIFLHAPGPRPGSEIAVLGAQIISHHAINDKRPVHFAGRSEDFSSRKIAPLIHADDAAGLHPLIVLV